ncbi:MupG family TIM beta-alpha barrel fold protein [[Acholeplasma] multilocale]|uniref:MupG family TIM beta-alpha barrel fold protein n=1 Tax=[Acholeplasma] multilocale TaxID=264638 RepID=UPI00047CFA5D|nr:DUF871 domain-containing protein [[Acholeplasma] multilocale]
MFKRELGISVYPEKFTKQETKKYILLAKKYGFNKMFLSFLQLAGFSLDKGVEDKEFMKNKSIYEEIIKFAKDNNFYVVVDVNSKCLEMTKSSSYDLSYYQDLGIDCLRLDMPLSPIEIAMITQEWNLDIQLNASMNDHILDDVLYCKPIAYKISGCHNFYPLANTGLAWNYFLKCSEKYFKKGVRLSAFIGSETGEVGPWKDKVGPLVTIDNHRCNEIDVQAQELWATGMISDLYIGNQPASESELEKLSQINRYKFQFEILLEDDLSVIEQKTIFDLKHFNRGDINDHFIRSMMGRIIFKNEKGIKKPLDKNHVFNLGDVVIVNETYDNYKYELLIVTEDGFSNFNGTVNLVGKIPKKHHNLIKMVGPWDTFEFKITN